MNLDRLYRPMVEVPTGNFTRWLQAQEPYCDWTYHCLFRRDTEVSGLPELLQKTTGDQRATNQIVAWVNERPYGLAFYYGTVVAWRILRSKETVYKYCRVLMFGKYSHILELGPAWGVLAAPPEVQRYAYMFFRPCYQTVRLMMKWYLYRAKRRGIKLPFKPEQSEFWWLWWHPSAPICLAEPEVGQCYACTKEAFWPIEKDDYMEQVMTAPKELAVLKALFHAKQW